MITYCQDTTVRTRLSVNVMNQSQSEAGIGLEFRLKQSYQVSEEGNRKGLGFNLCVVPLNTMQGISYNFGTVIRDWSWTEVRQKWDRVL